MLALSALSADTLTEQSSDALGAGLCCTVEEKGEDRQTMASHSQACARSHLWMVREEGIGWLFWRQTPPLPSCACSSS